MDRGGYKQLLENLAAQPPTQEEVRRDPTRRHRLEPRGWSAARAMPAAAARAIARARQQRLWIMRLRFQECILV
jgi:hypothetical protein